VASSILGNTAHKQDSRAAAQTGQGYFTLRKFLKSVFSTAANNAERRLR